MENHRDFSEDTTGIKRKPMKHGMMDYYHTGDTAWMDEDGYLWFVGRNDDIIKSSGYRIGPFEVESAVISHPSVLECAITGVPHPVRGQIVKATLYSPRVTNHLNELKKEIQNHVKSVTAPYKYPRVVEFVDELPKTISGKIRRIEIREKDEEEHLTFMMKISYSIHILIFNRQYHLNT